jgi:outer membrane protein assembly factor BamB
MKSVTLGVSLVALAGAGATPALEAQEWTRFRGPNGTGISDAKGIPVTWGEKDFRWKVKLAGPGHSQPVIWGQRLFLTVAREGGRDRVLVCFDKNDGRELWAKTYPLAPQNPIHKNSSHANGSPVVDEERVIASFVSPESFWVRSFDHAGHEQWSRNLGTFTSQHGHGASPMIYEHTVIVANDQDAESFVVALDLKTGQTVWQTPRRASDNGTSYATPCVHLRADGSPELLLASKSHGISSLDPKTGKMNWEAPAYRLRMAASPVVAGDLAIGSCGQAGGAGNYLAAVRLGGQGNVSKTHIAYTLKQGTPYVPTPLYRDGRLYWISDAGVATALEAATGREIWSARVRAEFFASPVMIDGRIYCPSTKGEMIVLATGGTFKELARNPLGEGSHSTPCVDGGRLYVRTFNHLLCIGKP